MSRFIPLLMSLLLVPGSALAQEREFDIEVLIFKRNVDLEQVKENWPESVEPINLSEIASFRDTQYLNNNGVTLLSQGDYQLNAERDTLDRHAGFEVLLHTAWRQGDQNRNLAPKFRIQAGKAFPDQYYADGTKVGSASATADTEQPQEPVRHYELDGELQVYVQHYLFVETTLDLKSPEVRNVTYTEKELDQDSQSEYSVLNDTEDSSGVQVGNLQQVSPEVVVEEYLKSFRMQQKRRMRSSETHYLDHPLMGMIIQVRRVEADVYQ